MSAEKTVNSSARKGRRVAANDRVAGAGGGDGRYRTNRKELSDTLAARYDDDDVDNDQDYGDDDDGSERRGKGGERVWSSGESNLLVVNRLHGTLCSCRGRELFLDGL